ncbi:hypothetical protein MMC11_008269 [Xylographa trunciseda]|nr:hypothetical protein [Xylographa trunciseda]
MAWNFSHSPKYADSDLQVTLPGGRIYHLHAGVFRRASQFFAQFLAEDLGAVLSARAIKDGVKLRYRIDLVGIETSNAHFVSRAINNMGHCTLFNSLPDLENGKVPNEKLKHYDNVFRSFYNEELDIETRNLATALHDCMGMVNIAENYDCVAAIRESVDVALLRQGQVLFKSISQNPVQWANFACRIRSPTIFKDSLIHLVGKWKMLEEDEHANLDMPIIEICQRKHEEFQLEKEAIELRILGHYSPKMQKAESDNPGRISYANDIYTWMGLSLFRQWFSQNICQGSNLQAIDGGYSFYLLLSKGGPAYLDHVQREGFHLYFPMTKKGKTVLENHLNSYKAEVQAFVAPLMANSTQLEFQDHNRPNHLLCLDVGENDYPWNAAPNGLEAGMDRDQLHFG